MDKSEINLPRIDENNNQTYNGLPINIGITPILNAFYDLSKHSRKPQWNLYLINIETLIRDAKNKELDRKQIGINTIKDCTVIAQYINEYCQLVLKENEKQTPIVCFYLPHYDKIPKNIIKEKLPKGTEERWDVLKLVENTLKETGFESHFEDTEILFSILNDEEYPHNQLFSDLYSHEKSITYRRVLMISHVPLDFHLYKHFKDFNILESYTGNIKTVKDLGKKVFSDDFVPFNKYTHLLFGDKWYINGFLKTSDKRRVKELAKEQKWAMMPDNLILEKIVKANLIDLKSISSPKI